MKVITPKAAVAAIFSTQSTRGRAASLAMIWGLCLCAPLHGQTIWTGVPPGPISYAGNVGIGTTSPQTKLEISGSGSDGAGNSDLRVTSTGSIGAGIQLNASGYGGRPYSILATQGSTGIPGSLGVYDTTTGTYRLVISPTGNVGIGAIVPGNKLHVTGTGASAVVSRITHTGDANSPGAALQVSNGYGVVNGYYEVFGVYGNNYATNYLSVRDNGSIGIGLPVTSAAYPYKLSVNGTIGAKEVIVTNTGWADYVFQRGYRLKPLTELAAYIEEHHHLPGIPSESEVKEKGVSVGEMQAKLLAKIEELTLHMIQAEERNRALQERVDRLEGRTSKVQADPDPTQR